MSSLRIFFVGGMLGFRALFSFLQPAIYVPSMLVSRSSRSCFVYIGRSAGQSRTSST